ncbi:phage terminase small subunit [Streptomyces cyaneofuscatus]
MPGPVSNREAVLARCREHKGGDVHSMTLGVAWHVKVPNADREWHPIAHRLWDTLKFFWQAHFCQASRKRSVKCPRRSPPPSSDFI